MAGIHTIAETERQVSLVLGSKALDFESMAVVANIFRASNNLRNHLERSVLQAHNLSWTGFVVLWVVWIWGPVETREVARESGISKGTLTGVMKTLEGRGYLVRDRGKTDGRLVDVSLTKAGTNLMDGLFPQFNQEETQVASVLSSQEKADISRLLRLIANHTAKD